MQTNSKLKWQIPLEIFQEKNQEILPPSLSSNCKSNNPYKIFPETFFSFVIKKANPETCKPSITEDVKKTKLPVQDRRCVGAAEAADHLLSKELELVLEAHCSPLCFPAHWMGNTGLVNYLS